MFSFTKSNKGQDLLVINNFIHRKRAMKNATTYWTCTRSDCKGSAKTINGVYSGGMKDHNHGQDIAQVIVRSQKEEIKSCHLCTHNFTASMHLTMD